MNQHIEQVKNQINHFALKYGRNSADISLLAVSKGQPVEKIISAIDTGQQSFGENYSQEAIAKIREIQDPKVEWHYLGNCQKNKLKTIAQHFHWVHSVSNWETCQLLNKHRSSFSQPLNICIQVNISLETSKGGICADHALELCAATTSLPHIQLRGLMTILAPGLSFAEQRKGFHQLSELFKDAQRSGLEIDTLSMGMTDDLESAIAEGATIVRIGRGVFGERG